MKRRFLWLLAIALTITVSFSCIIEGSNLRASLAEIAPDLYLPPRKDFRIVVISDLNSQYGATDYEPEVDEAISLIPRWQPDLVLCGGDAIAGQKATLTKSEIEAMWAAFDLHLAQPLRKFAVPYGFTIGNHDGSGALKNGSLVFEEERNLARAYWLQQQDRLGLNFVDRANFPFYYSFERDDVFFLVWDASTQQIAPQQLNWVEQSLQSPAARRAKAKIVIGHLPLYPVAKAKNKPGEYLAEGRKLRSLLTQNGVLMYISGHHHAYYPGKVTQLELLHAGALGRGARELINSDLSLGQTVTVIDLELETSEIIYTTYSAATWKTIALEELPAFIPSIDGKIFRHDLYKEADS